RNSTQNKRMKNTSPTSRVANSRRNDNYKVRDETSREQGAGSSFSFCHYATTPLLRLSVLHAPCSLLFTKTCLPSRDRRYCCSRGLPRNPADLRQRIQSRERTWPLSRHKASG